MLAISGLIQIVSHTLYNVDDLQCLISGTFPLSFYVGCVVSHSLAYA